LGAPASVGLDGLVKEMYISSIKRPHCRARISTLFSGVETPELIPVTMARRTTNGALIFVTNVTV
jgi:hypothetical protein